jgi:hypothetical protein
MQARVLFDACNGSFKLSMAMFVGKRGKAGPSVSLQSELLAAMAQKESRINKYGKNQED